MYLFQGLINVAIIQIIIKWASNVLKSSNVDNPNLSRGLLNHNRTL